ncbi:MAG TPA: hypothetical protein PLR25_00645, partial [Planctomycetaceae bacterium]|nr:hypothetical protein [Planctomycetaceae bacterium]
PELFSLTKLLFLDFRMHYGNMKTSLPFLSCWGDYKYPPYPSRDQNPNPTGNFPAMSKQYISPSSNTKNRCLFQISQPDSPDSGDSDFNGKFCSLRQASGFPRATTGL